MSKLKEKIRSSISKESRDVFFWRFRAPLILFRLYWCEAWLHIRYAFWVPSNDANRVQVRISMYSHVVEKGLAMPLPRSFYGKGVVRQLMKDLEIGLEIDGVPECIASVAYRVLERYISFHDGIPADESETKYLTEIRNFLDNCQISLCVDVAGGEKKILREELLQAAHQDFRSIATARRSIRNFSDEPVSLDVIKKAVSLAQMAPSACNLQPTHVYALKDKLLIQKVLELQTGARGFLQVVDTLFIITADIAISTGPRARNQGFIDNGLFAMNLMYSLLYYGVGSCPMHWSVLPSSDKALRKLVPIKDEHRVSMILVAGNLPESFNAPISQRVETGMILHMV